MAIPRTKASRLLAVLLMAAALLGAAAWVLRAGPAVAFTFATDDGLSDLHYSCALADDPSATLALAEQAHAAFQAELALIAQEGARIMHEAMTAANANGGMPDFGPMEAEKRTRLHRLVASIEQRFGCAVRQDVPW